MSKQSPVDAGTEESSEVEAHTEAKEDWATTWDAGFDRLLEEYSATIDSNPPPTHPSPWNDPTWDLGVTDGEWGEHCPATPQMEIQRSFREGDPLEQQWDFIDSMLRDPRAMPPGRFPTADEYAARLFGSEKSDKSAAADSMAISEQIDSFRRAELVETRQIAAEAQLLVIRDRYSLDDDLVFEAELRLSADAILWEEEREVLAEELRRVVTAIEYCENHVAACARNEAEISQFLASDC
ncbi:hypothetical protein C8R43DRAFT_1128269 [Mycena crocata]|nr:hypothetical protein C8R43DRAFT_1128269 [Mycena crocata]